MSIHLLQWMALYKVKYNIRSLDREEEKSYHGINQRLIQRAMVWEMTY